MHSSYHHFPARPARHSTLRERLRLLASAAGFVVAVVLLTRHEPAVAPLVLGITGACAIAASALSLLAGRVAQGPEYRRQMWTVDVPSAEAAVTPVTVMRRAAGTPGARPAAMMLQVPASLSAPR